NDSPPSLPRYVSPTGQIRVPSQFDTPYMHYRRVPSTSSPSDECVRKPSRAEGAFRRSLPPARCHRSRAFVRRRMAADRRDSRPHWSDSEPSGERRRASERTGSHEPEEDRGAEAGGDKSEAGHDRTLGPEALVIRAHH